jgi:hypothetical protein
MYFLASLKKNLQGSIFFCRNFLLNWPVKDLSKKIVFYVKKIPGIKWFALSETRLGAILYYPKWSNLKKSPKFHFKLPNLPNYLIYLIT